MIHCHWESMFKKYFLILWEFHIFWSYLSISLKSSQIYPFLYLSKFVSLFFLKLIESITHFLVTNNFPIEFKSCYMILFLEQGVSVNKHPLTLYMELVFDQSRDKFQLLNQWVLFGKTNGNVDEGYRNISDSKTWIVHPHMGDSSEKLKTWSALGNLQPAQQVRECPFQVSRLA